MTVEEVLEHQDDVDDFISRDRIPNIVILSTDERKKNRAKGRRRRASLYNPRNDFNKFCS